jgi:FKBP-type peptidyl-prolyl cis-trans isomerase FklB
VHKTMLSLTAGLILGAAATPLAAAEPAEPPPGAIYNYFLGYQVIDRMLHRLGQNGVERSDPDLRAGIEDRLGGKDPRFSQDQVMAAVQTLQAEHEAKVKAEAEAKRAEGEAFLAENAKRDGVKVLPSGLQYLESRPGTGAQPTAESMVVVNYRGTHINGEEFDSSYARGEPAKFPASGVIPGFREALLNMREGAKWRIFVPSDLAYGEKGAGDRIGPNETLIFDLELIEVVKD